MRVYLCNSHAPKLEVVIHGTSPRHQQPSATVRFTRARLYCPISGDTMPVHVVESHTTSALLLPHLQVAFLKLSQLDAPVDVRWRSGSIAPLPHTSWHAHTPTPAYMPTLLNEKPSQWKDCSTHTRLSNDHTVRNSHLMHYTLTKIH